MAKKHRSYEPSRNRAAVELRAVRVVFERDSGIGLGAAGLEERREDYKRGKFELLKMCAEAHVEIAGVDQMLYSEGLSCIQSDAEVEYLEELVAEEWKILRNVLKAVGVPTAELPLEVDRAWIEWRM